MATNRGSVMKELHKLLRKADKLYDGQVEFVLDDGEKMDFNEEQEDVSGVDETYMSIFFFITPNDGLYKRARVKFHMRVNVAQYPDLAPEINCRNNIYHPNINVKDDYYDDEVDICVNLLDSDWEPEVGLDGAVMAVLFLFYNPQLDDALSPVCTGIDDYEEYKANVRRSLLGEEIDGYIFDKLLDESTDTEVKVGEGNAETTVITKDIEEKKQSGAGAVPENIVVNVEKEKDTVLKTSDAKIEVEPQLVENSVTNDDTNNAIVIKSETSDDQSNDAVTMTTTVAVTTAAETTDITSGHTVLNDNNADTLVTVTDAIESNKQTVFKPNLPHQNTPKSSVFKFWYSKLKDRLSPFYSSFKKRS